VCEFALWREEPPPIGSAWLQGDVIDVVADGTDWTTVLRDHLDWQVFRVPGVSVEYMQEYLRSAFNAEGQIILKRMTALDPSLWVGTPTGTIITVIAAQIDDARIDRPYVDMKAVG
jgi:hypothetical protein